MASGSRARGRGSAPIFRVFYSGPALEGPAEAALEGIDLRWEGSEHDTSPIGRHRALVGADSQREAIGVVEEALKPYGRFADFHATPVTDASGEVKRTRIRNRWEDVDWDEVQSKTLLSELERKLIGTFPDAAEPTWIILRDPDVPNDRPRVEAALRGLERRGLVYTTKEESGESGRETELVEWWALTDTGWDLLGLIKSPRYR